MTDQPRQPAGSPHGGQFAGTSGAESTLPLEPPGPLPIRDGILDVDVIPADVTDYELAAITSPDAPLRIRVLAASSPYQGVADRCATDPNPLVRAIAAANPLTRQALADPLHTDESTVRALGVLVGAGSTGGKS